MNQEIKKEWVKALKSGKYKQGQGTLRNDDKFCCLGVLCDIHSKKTKTAKWCFIDSWGNKALNERYLGHNANLPSSVRDWSKLNHDDEKQLIDLNDTERLTLEEIALYIENGL